MTIINVPDIKGPTAQLCFKQKLDPPHVMVRCDRRKGHSGLHSWEMVAQIEELTALPPSSPVADSPTWRPIETCPDHAEFIIGYWPVGDSFEVGEMLKEESVFWEAYGNVRISPTHWMPLPSAPSPSAGAAKEPKP